ncbi:MAG: AbrB/MazE/SpoVT family DNA-binding domain-containing protein [Ruminococcus sp.]|nr:AbrB/MazE/SpoVT family DNA-binding domain-containing protein [Ruminococcus sp.]
MIYKSYKKIDSLGRVHLPKDFRREIGLGENDDILIEVKENAIVITKAEENCVFCGKTDDLRSYKGKFVCADCIKILNTT